jgi:ATP-dependent DNA helicase PIF1
MTNRQCFEDLDGSLRDIQSHIDPNAKEFPFGGKVVVLGGDVRQILPVIENGSKNQIIHATIIKSYLWNHVHILKLTENMRLKNTYEETNEYIEL